MRSERPTEARTGPTVATPRRLCLPDQSRGPWQNQKGRPRAPETQLQAADHSGATSMKSGASSVTQCDLQVTAIIGILNAHCGPGSSRGRARLRVVIRQQPPRASLATSRAGALDRTGAPYHRSARGLKRARPRLIARGACCNTRRKRRKARRRRRSLSRLCKAAGNSAPAGARLRPTESPLASRPP